MANPNSSAQRSFAAEPYDSVAAVLASKQITAALEGQVIKAKTGEAWVVASPSATVYSAETVGGAKLVALPQTTGATPYSAFATPSSRTLDNTAKINAAIAANQEVTIPPGEWRVDGGLTLGDNKVLTFATGAKLLRSSDYTTNTEPMINLRGSRAKLLGANIQFSSVNHPDGIIAIGTLDTDDAVNHWYCEVDSPEVVGARAAGNVGIRFMSAYPYKGPNYASYFHRVTNPIVREADIGILMLEDCNANYIQNPQFWAMGAAAIRLRGAYGNTIMGGFVHTSSSGVIGLHLMDNQVPGHILNTSFNNVVGLGFEPNVSLETKAWVIEDGCEGNFIQMMDNSAGGSTNGAGSNTIFSSFGTSVLKRLTLSGDVTRRAALRTPVSVEKSGRKTVPENSTAPLFSVTVPSGSVRMVDVEVLSVSSAIGRSMATKATYALRWVSGDLTAIKISGGSSEVSSADAFEFSVSGGVATGQVKTYNNGTSSNYNVVWNARLITPAGTVYFTDLTVL